MRQLLTLIFVSALVPLPCARAQQPFFNDDADVVAYRRFHFESNNEYDALTRSAYPNLRQDTQTIKFSYGLFHNCEVGMDFPVIVIFNARGSGLGNPFGLGDTDYSIKYNFHTETLGSRWPGITASLNIEPPAGREKAQLGPVSWTTI